MPFYTADICDAHSDTVRLFAPKFQNYGGAASCEGVIETITLDEDNTGLITLLKKEVDGHVAVVNVGGSYVAVVGENLMNLAAKNGWSGIIVNGYVRDIHATSQTPVALYALGTCPRKSTKKADAITHQTITLDGIEIHNGEYLYADLDGIIVMPKKVN